MADGSDHGWVAVVLAVLCRPWLWLTAVRQMSRMAATGWWRRPPFLPRPPVEYVAFRQLTATGSSTGAPRPNDVVTWLAWCRAWPRIRS